MDGQNTPRTVDEVYDDYLGRRLGLIKALTTGASLNPAAVTIFCLKILEEKSIRERAFVGDPRVRRLSQM
jgi:hypothetical protein